MVGIVVDQMRNDYLERFQSKWGKNGFRLLMEEGFWCKNTHYNYFPTYTGPGHASIYTGSTPAQHGIIANDWYDRISGQEVYCTQDNQVHTVGSFSVKAGQMSPKNLRTSTITDQLKLATQQQAKVMGISLKDRGAILPAGFFSDAAYWFDPAAGGMITSSFYMDSLPLWVQAFNDKKLSDTYLDQTWETLLPIYQYYESGPDNSVYETVLKGKKIPTFPYPLARLRKNYKNFDLLKYTPWGNTLIAEFALEALEREEFGKDSITDFMCISFSSTDYIGHEFGPRSIELEDAYLRLDAELARIFEYLDQSVGYGNYLVFLTSDHGVAENANYLKDEHKNVGIFETNNAVQEINTFIRSCDSTKRDSVVYYGNQQFYFTSPNYGLTTGLNLIKQWAASKEAVLDVWGSSEVFLGTSSSVIRYKNGFQSKRSGDVFLHLASGWTEYKATGATHGSIYSYDTHVPLLWMGGNIPRGSSVRENTISDIAKTLAYLLKINEPESCQGRVIEELFKEP